MTRPRRILFVRAGHWYTNVYRDVARLRAELLPSVYTLSRATVVGIAAGDVRAGGPVTVTLDGRVQAAPKAGKEV